jgi:hypothetical protein
MHRLNLILLILAIARFLWASAFHQNTVYTNSVNLNKFTLYIQPVYWQKEKFL